MTDILQIRSKEKLFEDIVVEGLKEHVSQHDIRLNLIDAMRKEVFGQMCWRMKVDDPLNALHTPKNEEIVKNISIQARKKWEALIRMCNRYRETFNLIKPEDLQEIWADEEDEDTGYEIGEAEDPEWPEIEKEDEDEELSETDIHAETADGGLAEGADGNGYGAENATGTSGLVEIGEIMPGMRFPAGYWTR